MELRDYLNVIQARKWIIILTTVIVAGTALVASLMEEPVYQSEARVLIAERSAVAELFGGLPSEFSGLETQMQLMKTRPLAEYTVQALGLDISPGAVIARTNVSAVGKSSIVSVRVTDIDPERAAAIANQMAEEYVAWSRETRREDIAMVLDELDSQLEAAEEREVELTRRIEEEIESTDLAAAVRVMVGLFGFRRAEKYEDLAIQYALESGTSRVVSAATASTAPISPQPKRNAVLGLAVGLVFGLGLAFFYEYLDTKRST